MPAMTLEAPRTVTPESAGSLLGALRRKQQVVSQLIAGRLGLAEAAAAFRQATESAGHAGVALLSPLPADAESLCRAVIGWVHLSLSDRPEQAEAVSSRLESELQAELDRFGSVRLPLSA
jgi:hypothetical protein